jgi:choloylglycine hydrolase
MSSRTPGNLFLSLLALSACIGIPSAKACSRIFLNRKGCDMVTGRTFDLYMEDKPVLVYLPAGTVHPGSAKENRAGWTSKYASIGVRSFNAGIGDGMNEKGLAAHLLYLDGSKYEPKDARPILNNIAWVEYVLDNYATVEEALKGLAKVRVAPSLAGGREWPLHLAIEDAKGDSAVIEYVDGKLSLHHGKEFTVMTNEPPLGEQLENLKKYKLFGGKLPMPGDIDPASRFVRASSYLKTLPDPKSQEEAVGYIAGVLRTTMVPFGAEDTGSSEAADTWPTRWSTLADLSAKRFYYLPGRSPNAFWVDLRKLAKSKKPLALKPSSSLEGDVTARMLSSVSKG